MRKIIMLTAALGLVFGAAATADAQKIDKNGRCHDSAGKFAKMEVCKGGAAAPTDNGRLPGLLPPHAMMAPAHTYKFDPKGKCRDEKGKMAKKGLCH